ncbi:hypothetical protein EGR_07267 [Echinococcus granulosus]|uniref:Uncharacterized protein n=1 Tax=Echinococcus granulosus TaxID=6210 RepID=W6UA37_ECHGR|nr:hypothetical protein EGR_07267 [Echinococcus granulosus]EUB57905.1 hypothetical protein EGR_07267 [Echinococcus granulosus]
MCYKVNSKLGGSFVIWARRCERDDYNASGVEPCTRQTHHFPPSSLQAIRALVNKIRRSSSGEIVEEGLPSPLPQIPEEEEERSLNFHALGPVIDIDEEAALPVNYNEMEESSGLPIGYVDEWNSLLPPQGPPKPVGHYNFGEVDGRSDVIGDLEEESDVTAVPRTAGCKTGQPAARFTFVLALVTAVTPVHYSDAVPSVDIMLLSSFLSSPLRDYKEPVNQLTPLLNSAEDYQRKVG